MRGTKDGPDQSALFPHGNQVLELWTLFARAFIRAGEVEVSHLVVRRRSEPDVTLRVEEKFPHHGFGMREGIFDHFSGIGIQASN
jgi:hypothetical protein